MMEVIFQSHQESIATARLCSVLSQIPSHPRIIQDIITGEVKIITSDVRRARVDAPPHVDGRLPLPRWRTHHRLQILVWGISNHQLFGMINEIYDFELPLGIEILWLLLKLVPMHICSGVAPGHDVQHRRLTSLPHRLVLQATPNVTHESQVWCTLTWAKK
jgi:hypothetical protein